VRLAVDDAIYPQAAVEAFVDSARRPLIVTRERSRDTTWLTLSVSDATEARTRIGEALNELLRLSLLARR